MALLMKGSVPMAVRDHSLDPLIITAAREEFMTHGFQKASLHKIADRAGITTGALYTRYKNKDALFCSLVEPVLQEMAVKSQPIRALYEKVQENPSSAALLKAIRQEEQIYLDLLFDHYEDCILLFCKCSGSALEKQIQQMKALKSSETVTFFKRIARRDLNCDGIELIMNQQFYYYQQILQRGYNREQAVSCMKTVELFLEAGWKTIFERIL